MKLRLVSCVAIPEMARINKFDEGTTHKIICKYAHVMARK